MLAPLFPGKGLASEVCSTMNGPILNPSVKRNPFNTLISPQENVFGVHDSVNLSRVRNLSQISSSIHFSLLRHPDVPFREGPDINIEPNCFPQKSKIGSNIDRHPPLK
mgnify:CR=1 FL=1